MKSLPRGIRGGFAALELTLVAFAALASAGSATVSPALAGPGPPGVRGPALDSRTFGEPVLRDLRLLVVQDKGRLKPLDTLARETVRFVTEKPRYRRQEPVVTCLSWMFEGDQWLDTPIVKIGYLPLKRDLGLDTGRSLFSMRELRQNAKLMELLRAVDEKGRGDGKLTRMESEARLAGARFIEVKDVMDAEVLHLIPNPTDPVASWSNFQEMVQAPLFDTQAVRDTLLAVIIAFRQRDPAHLATAAASLRSELGNIAPQAMPSNRALQSECRYNALDPFQRACGLYFLAFLVLLASMFFRHRLPYGAGFGLVLLGFALQVYGEALRLIVSGRPPVSNIYESLIFVAAAIVLLALVFELVYRARIFALTASGLGVVSLVLAARLPIDPGISPPVPALRDNTWLAFHVFTVLCGYAAAFLAGGLAYVGLGSRALGRAGSPFATRLDRLHYRVVQVAVLFLTAGILLGGVWAKKAWGRYWGWDPKETSALISLLVYLVIVHGRHAGWLQRFGTNVASVIGLNLVVMTYYGANYFLVGLHGYARGSETNFHVPLGVYLFLAAEIAFVLLAYLGPVQRQHGIPAQAVAPAAPAPEAEG